VAFLQLDGLGFCTRLPAFWQDHYTQNPLESSRYLAVLAQFEREEAPTVSDMAPELNAKLDLALLWLARSLGQTPVQTLEVSLALEEIGWLASQPLSPGQEGALVIQLSAHFPFALQLPAQISSCQALGTDFAIRARLIWPSEELQDWYERTVFRYHRRDIQHRREA